MTADPETLDYVLFLAEPVSNLGVEKSAVKVEHVVRQKPQSGSEKPIFSRQSSHFPKTERTESVEKGSTIPLSWQVMTAYYSRQISRQDAIKEKPLCQMSSKTWHLKTEVGTPRCPHSLRLHYNGLWLVHDDGILVYDSELCFAKSLLCPKGVRSLRDVGFLENGDLVLASLVGLFTVSQNGTCSRQIDNRIYVNVHCICDQIYAFCKNNTSLLMYTFTDNSWKCTSQLAIPGRKMQSLTFAIDPDNMEIELCSSANNTFYLYSKEGDIIRTCDKNTADGAYQWPKRPFLCSIEDSGVRLVADHNRNRLRVWDRRYTWQDIVMNKYLDGMRSAIHFNGVLYVMSWSRDLLCSYT